MKSEAEWRDFLAAWSAELVGCPELAGYVPEAAVRSRWLGYPPATAAQIAAAEARLGVALPASYAAFLRVTNGWRTTGFFVQDVWGADRVDWYRTRHREDIEAWFEGLRSYGDPPAIPDSSYLVYGDGQDPADFRSEYLHSALQVSGVWDGAVYLLNPEIRAPDGEWEAWRFASWPDGIRRWRSFSELLEAERQAFHFMRKP